MESVFFGSLSYDHCPSKCNESQVFGDKRKDCRILVSTKFMLFKNNVNWISLCVCKTHWKTRTYRITKHDVVKWHMLWNYESASHITSWQLTCFSITPDTAEILNSKRNITNVKKVYSVRKCDEFKAKIFNSIDIINITLWKKTILRIFTVTV